jgi:hypothetical protein
MTDKYIHKVVFFRPIIVVLKTVRWFIIKVGKALDRAYISVDQAITKIPIKEEDK